MKEKKVKLSSAVHIDNNPFRRTKKLLQQLEYRFLRCVKCGNFTDSGIYCLKNCDHKYCGDCVTQIISEEMCLICDVKTNKRDITVDAFFMAFMQRIKRIKRVVEDYEKRTKTPQVENVEMKEWDDLI